MAIQLNPVALEWSDYKNSHTFKLALLRLLESEDHAEARKKFHGGTFGRSRRFASRFARGEPPARNRERKNNHATV